MADISDVENSIVISVTSTLYPAGSSRSSIIGSLCRIYRGWPNAATLNADLAAGVINLTVNAVNESGRTTTRYLPKWQIQSAKPGTTANVAGQTISFGGTPAVGDMVGLMINRRPYVYQVQDGDTGEQIASNLARLVQANCAASASGSQIAVNGAWSVIARVVCTASGFYEARRQVKDVQLACWCPDPTSRDAVASAVDSTLAAISFLPLSDTTSAHICYKSTTTFDQAQNAHLYRRDLVYTIEYATIATSQFPEMLFGDAVVNGNSNYG